MEFGRKMIRGLALTAFVGAAVAAPATAALASSTSTATTGTVVGPMIKCPPECVHCNKC